MKKTKKYIIISAVLIISALILIIPFLIKNSTLTGKTIENDNLNTYTYTKAICNESNYCQDYEVKCEGNKTISATPLTGAVVQFSEDWEDPRDEEIKNKLCE